MIRVIRETRIEHTFGGEEASGWLPPHAAAPLRTPKRIVPLRVTITDVDGGYILAWEGPTPHDCGDHWYLELEYAEHAAEELFGITSESWPSAA